MKKFAEDIIILHTMISYMRYSSWDLEWDRNFGYFRPFFNPLSSNNPENQNSEEMKKAFVDVILNLCNKFNGPFPIEVGWVLPNWVFPKFLNTIKLKNK